MQLITKKKIYRALLCLGVLIGSVLTFSAAKPVSAASSKTFVAAENQSIDSLDPANYTSMTSAEMIHQIDEGLYRYDQNNKVVPGLAKGQPKISKGQRVYTFTLRNAKWSNGDPVTADDFVYALQLKADPKNSSSILDFIQNGQDIRLNKKPTSDLGVKALSTNKLQITLVHPIPFMKQYLTNSFFMPVDRKFASKLGNKYGTSAKNTLSCGPFVLKGWTGTNDTWTLVKNPNYYDKNTIKVNKISVKLVKDTGTALNLFDSGNVDYTPVGDNNVAKYQGNKSLHQILTPTIGYISMNIKRSTTANVHLRRAIAYAINKTALTKNFLQDGSKPLNGLIPAGMAKNPKTGEDYRKQTGNLITYDPKTAKSEWQQAQKELGKKKLTLELLSADTTQARSVSEYLQSQIEKNLPGLTINIKAIPVAQRIQFEQDGNYDLAFGTYAPDYADPLSLLYMYQTGQKLNFSHYSNPAFDKKIAAASSSLATNVTARYANLQSAEKILMQDAALAPVYQAGDSYLLSSRYSGFVIHPFGQLADYRYLQPKK